MKKIELTDEQYSFLDTITTLMTNQSNRSTAWPLFYVYEIKEVWVAEGDSNDGTVWLSDGQVKYRMTNKEWDDQTAERYDDECGRRENYREEGVPVLGVGPFFTEALAKDHIRLNSYHYNKPYTYVWGAWRNGEMQRLMTLLFAMLGKEVPMPYHGE